MAGVGLRATQDALGHKSIAVTVRYSHLAPDFLLNVVEKLVPQTAEARSEEPTDTTTDTSAFSPPGASIDAYALTLFRVRCCDSFTGA
jgi:hypothetical protein